MNIDKSILKIAVPAIVSNITVPLLGLCDTTIAGHMGASAYIGAIAVGTMMINVVFWCLGFLRMGTTGLTSQAYGSGDVAEQRRVFTRALGIALLAGCVIILLQMPLREGVIQLIAPEPQVREAACLYFDIVIWGAPAMLAAMAVSGWFLGMQTSVYPMVIAIVTNLLNIVISLVCVYGLKMGFAGTATGTLAANWFAFAFALVLIRRFCGGRLPLCSFRALIQLSGLGRFFRVNTDIFFRSFCIVAVSLGMTHFGARLGADTLAVNAVMMQFFIFFSQFMDGFAFAGEALTGKAIGAADRSLMRLTVKHLMLWGLGIALLFTVVYAVSDSQIIGFITDNNDVRTLVAGYRVFLLLIPLLTVSAFIFDGIYIGMTATRPMLWVTLCAGTAFYLLYMMFPHPIIVRNVQCDNDILWTAFLAYLVVRGAGLALLYRRESKKFFS